MKSVLIALIVTVVLADGGFAGWHYFAKKSWYKINSNFSESSLSSTENKNVATILACKQETNSSLHQTDSGCDTNS